MKCKLLAYNKEPLEIDVNQIASISGISKSNVIIVLNSGVSHTGYMVRFDN